MTALELALYETSEAGRMLRAILDDFPIAGLDAKPSTHSMSAREIAEHQCEVYIAAEKKARGLDHDWGTYRFGEPSWPALKDKMFALRHAAVVGLCVEDDDLLRQASSFLVAHDHYHIGQLVTVRLKVQPDWNSYCIYES